MENDLKRYRSLTDGKILCIQLFLLLSFFTINGYSGTSDLSKSFDLQQTIQGKVLDEQGLPLPGVTILVKGTQNGTSSDFEGDFSLEAPSDAILVASYVGFYILKEETVMSMTMSIASTPMWSKGSIPN